MKFLGILFVLIINIIALECKCGINSIDYNPWCGLTATCNFQGANRADVLNEACRRKLYKKTAFQKTFKGICPKNKKPTCLPTNDKPVNG